MGQLNVNGTIDTTGNVLTPNRPAFRIKVSNHNAETFGSDSGQTYTVAYDDIFPLFKSAYRTVEQNIGGCITFHDRATSTGTGTYWKFTAPVAGLYAFGLQCEVQAKNGDWVSMGFKTNETTSNDFMTYSLSTHFNSDDNAGGKRATCAGQITISLAAGGIVVPGCQSHENSFLQNPANFWYGYLIG